MTGAPNIRIPESAVREFEDIERIDWTPGLTLPKLLVWVNGVATRFRPLEIGVESRASEEFTPRTFRHYQTRGCIDAPDRVGKHAVYRFRQYVQALLLRKLIWERLPSEQIATIMKGRTTADLKQLLFDGIEVVARNAEPPLAPQGVSDESWRRISVAPGVELHLRADLAKPRPQEMNDWLTRLETALRQGPLNPEPFMNEPHPSLVSQLRADVESICLPEGRMVGSPGHRRAREVLSRRLRDIGCEPWRGDDFEMPYEDDGESFCNLAGVVRGRDSRLAPLLVGAHYDSVIEAPCADDNAAAVAIALAVAEHLKESRPLDRDLVVAIFDAEEPPYFLSPSMGSWRFWEDQRDGRPIHAAVIMDLVGHDVSINGLDSEAQGSLMSTLAPLLFMTGTESHPELRGVLERAGDIDKLKVVPTLNRYVDDMSDHGVFRQNGVPYLFLSCGRWEHYHKETDTPDRLNYLKMERITRQVLAFAAALDNTQLPQTGSEQFSETLDLEISGMRRAFGSLLKPILGRCGMEAVTTRSDVDRLVATLLRLGV